MCFADYPLDTLLAEMQGFLPYNSIEDYQQYEQPLHCMFAFKHLKAADDQSDGAIYRDLFTHFVGALENQVSTVHRPTKRLHLYQCTSNHERPIPVLWV